MRWDEVHKADPGKGPECNKMVCHSISDLISTDYRVDLVTFTVSMRCHSVFVMHEDVSFPHHAPGYLYKER